MKLKEVCKIIGGNPAPKEGFSDSANAIPFVRMKDLGRAHVTNNLINVEVKIDPDFAKKKRLKIIKKGSVLLPRSGSVALNHRAVLGQDSFMVSHICALEVNHPQLNNQYLYYCLRVKKLDNITKKTTGLDAITFEDLGNIDIDFPSTDKQSQIVQRLNVADNLRQKRKGQLTLLDDYFKSGFLDMFGDPLTNNKGITQRKIGDLGEIITGNTPSRQKKEYYGAFIEWIKSDNINTPEFILTKAEEFLSKAGAKVGRITPEGVVLVTCIAGSPECIGNCAISDRKVAFNQQINAFVPGDEIKTEFFFAQLYICKRLIQQASTESMKGMVSKSRFSEIKILVPSLEQQTGFVKIFNSVAKMREKMRTSLGEMDNHFNALMQRYFG